MEYNPLVTVIIPTFNRAYIIEETLESILNQTYSNWECIVVDDGGVDNTRELIEKFNEKKNGFTFVKRPTHLTKGVCACRNYGVELARGEFIIFLDSDDILAHNSLDMRVKCFKENPNYDFLVFTTQFFKENIGNKQEVFNIDPIIENRENYLALFLSHKFSWTVMSPIWKKSVFLNYKFRNELHLLEDVVFHIEVLFDDKIKFKRINEIDNFYRIPNWGKNNSSISTKRIFESTSFLLNTYNHEIKKNSLLENKFSGFIKFVYSIIVKSNSSYYEKRDMMSYLRNFKYITFKERLVLDIFFVIYILKLNKVKNIGMYKLINYLNKILYR